MEQRYFIELSFKGTEYHGWQSQPNAISVQQIIEEAFGLLIKENIRITGAGRTDTGVHASYFVAHFNTGSGLLQPYRETVRKLNHMLPRDIAVISIFPVSSIAHSRFSALSRTYKYNISKRKDPFRHETSCFLSGTLDLEAMNRAAGELFNHRDFGSFARTNTDVRTNICTIMHAGWEECDDTLVFTIKANRFLRNMVRAIVGTMLKIGYGKLSFEEFRNIIEARDRRRAGTSALAQGLILTEIEYPSEILLHKNEYNENYD